MSFAWLGPAAVAVFRPGARGVWGSVRVLILNHEFPPLGGGGGWASYEIGRQLVRSGHRVTVVTTTYQDLPAFEEREGIEIHRVYGRRRSLLDNDVGVTMLSFLTLGTRVALRLARERAFDVVHAFFTIPAGLVGAWLKGWTGTPLVVSLRGADVPYHNPDEFRGVIRLLSPLLARVWRRADRVVALSNGLRRTAERTAEDVPFRVIYNGVDTELFKSGRAVRANGVPRLITVARLVQRKGIQHLLSALAGLRDRGFEFQLAVIGEGNYRAALEAQCRDLGLGDRVEFVGFVPHERLPAAYARADLFVLPSLTESFGQVFAEAMACGLPVIGTTVGGIPEVVGPEQAGWLVGPGDVEALTGLLATALRSPEQRRQMGARNAATVRRRFSWAGVAREYADLYAEICQGEICPGEIRP